MTSPHQVSSSVSRNGRPPNTAIHGTGTSIVRTADFSTVLGYRRTRTCREPGSSTGANRTLDQRSRELIRRTRAASSPDRISSRTAAH
jgi:hypothetical protein